MDVHNVCLAVALVSLSVTGVVVWLAFVSEGLDSESVRHERHIRSLLRDIQASVEHTQNTPDHESSTSTAPLNVPWPGLDRTLGNYFTRGYFNHKGKYHQEYTHSPLTILPFFHDEGEEFERCLKKTALAHNQAVSPELTLQTRHKWDTSFEGVFKFKHKFKLHYGRASFMACDWGQMGLDSSSGVGMDAGPARCGHAFIIQDPLSLAIADLGKCLLEPKGQTLCQQVRQNKTSVEEWVAARGNVVFKHILFHSEICQNHPQLRQGSQREPQPHQPKNGNPEPHEACDKNHEAFIDSLQPETINHLVNFITRNVHKLFSVVGLFEDLGKSLTMLNRVFRLPLHECEFLSKFSKTTSSVKPNYVHRMKHNAIQDTSQNRMRFDLVENLSYKNIASLLRLKADSEDDFSLLEAFKHIENSMTRSQESPATSDSNSNISENHERLDINFDYDFLDVNASDSQDFSDLNTSDSRDYSDVDVNMDVNDSDASMDSFKNPDNITTPQNSVLYYKQVTDSMLSNDSEEDDEDAGDYNEEDSVPEDTLLVTARELQTHAVRARLYKMFKDSEAITKSLSADLRIYKAVKQLYSLQKRLVFNSIKTI
ncbi:hypothetical protein BsWGS_24045 [Bradybaena similaris]